MPIGQRIKWLRKERGLTQEELGNALSIRKSTVSQYENNINTPDSKMVKKIADFFNVSTDYILGRTDSPISINELKDPSLNYTTGKPLPILKTASANGSVIDKFAGVKKLREGDYFYFQVIGDSMIASRIFKDDLVLVRRQKDVEDGQVSLVVIQGKKVDLKRIYTTKDYLILQSDNPAYPPLVLKKEQVEIIGRVVEVKFKT